MEIFPTLKWYPFLKTWAFLTLTALGGGLGGPPLDKCCRARQTAARWAAPLYDFFLWSLTDILTPSLRKSDIPLRSHMTFYDQRSTRKVTIFSFCVQNKWQSAFFILACKSVIFSSFCFVYHSFSLLLIQLKIPNNKNHKTIKYIRIKKQ